MRCKRVLDRLDDHVDGLLAVPKAEAIRDHMDACDDCRETALAMRAASTSLATWNDVEPPADGFEKILARLEALPLEAFEHAAPPPRGFLARMPRLASIHGGDVRRFTTAGLAAAAGLLAAAVVYRTDAPTTRHLRLQPNADGMSAPSALFPAGYDFDDGLLHNAPRGALRPVRASSPFELLEPR